MTTVLTKPVARETPHWVRTPKRMRPLVVTLSREGILVRAKGTRKSYVLPYGTAWVKAAELEADLRRREKKLKRKK
jgi:hypothetical protein